MTYAFCEYCWPYIKMAERSDLGKPHKKCETADCECLKCHPELLRRRRVIRP